MGTLSFSIECSRIPNRNIHNPPSRVLAGLMLSSAVDLVAEAIGRTLLSLLLWLGLFPVIWLLATPVVFAAAPFAPIPYWEAVKGFYGCVTDLWARWGLSVFP